MSRRGLLAAAGAVGLGLGLPACSARSSMADKAAGSGRAGSEVFYWISHGAATDQIWVQAVNGANQAAKDFGVTVRTSFHNNNSASQKQAFTSAIATKPKGIATTIPEPGVLNDVIKQAMDAGIPVVTTNTDDPTSGRVAFVGADLTQVGVLWARYLLDHKLVKPGDKVWLPVEVAGATYQTAETTGIKSVFGPMNISVDVFQAGVDPAQALAAMQNYLTAHGNGIAAVIGLGDLVMSSIQRAFTAIGWRPGKVPVVGWGDQKPTVDALKAGYVQAATWQFADSQGYQPIALLKMIADGLGAGYDITTVSLYTRENVAKYERFIK